MNNLQVEHIIESLFQDAKYDGLRVMKSAAKSVFGSFTPENFKDVYLSISREQGEDLRKMIVQKDIKNIVEFGTSFGISTLFLAQGAMETKGKIVTTELIESKAHRAMDNFCKAGVQDLIELRVGDAMETLQDYNDPIDLLLLDGWKDLYYPLFNMLEHNFHRDTIIYVDNADMGETKHFLYLISKKDMYDMRPLYGGKVMILNPKDS